LNSVFFYLNDNIGDAVGDNGTILKTTDGGGLITSASEISNPESFVRDYSMEQNYPNPFNPETIINYELGITNFVTLKVYDAVGKEVAMLVNERQNEGRYSVTFNGSKFSSGLYFYRLQINGKESEARRMLLLK
jgi:Secretion system C-terminal sorting domain